MIDFESARHDGFNLIAETDGVRILDSSERRDVGLEKFSEVWEIVTEIFLPDGSACEISLLMALPDDFPLVLPKIYIAKNDRKLVGYIPHLDVAGNVCYYDEETITINPHEPSQLIKRCLDEARVLIEKGMRRENEQDFIDEFVAYWSEQYDDGDTVSAGLTLIENFPTSPPCTIRFWGLGKAFIGYYVVLYADEKSSLQFQEYLHQKGYLTTEEEAFYLGTVKRLKPPFSFTNGDIFQLVKENFPHAVTDFESYINRMNRERLILFSVGNASDKHMVGLYINPLITRRNGYRPGNLKPVSVFKTFQRSDHALRIRFEEYTRARLQKRTDGFERQIGYSFSIAGLGSIGSNLLPFLLPCGIKELQLFDPDTLTLGNINRHLLGPDHIGKAKVEGIHQCLSQSDPFMEITSFKESVVQVARNKPEIINGSDFLFVIVGKSTIENFISDLLRPKILNVPVFFIWIEPYLLGGHCLYLQPGHSITEEDLYEDHLFKYNIIDRSEYKNPEKELQLREAGCQGRYTPYGQQNITLFLSSLAPHLYNLIGNKDLRNLILTWRGYEMDGISVKVSPIGSTLPQGEIKMFEL